MLTVYRPGSPVTLADGIAAGVLKVEIRANNYVLYEVVWWNGNARNTAWLEEAEVAPAEGSSTATIGFAAAGGE